VPRRSVSPALAGAAFGIAAELASGARQGLALALADLGVGLLLLGLGTAARLRRPASRTGVWMALAGWAWFAGTLGGPLAQAHRALLAVVVLSYPTGRLPASWLARVALAGAVVAALPVRDDRLDVAVSLLVVGAALRRWPAARGTERAAAARALLAATALGGVVALAAGLRLTELSSERPVLWAYDVVIAAVACGLFADLVHPRWSDAALRGLVVDLGRLQSAMTLQGRLGRALGDPSLVVGIWDAERRAYRDESGAVVEPPADGAGRRVTAIDDQGAPLALLVHDDAALSAGELRAPVAALTRIAVANAALEHSIDERVREIEASRRRLVEAADAERRALRRTIARGPERRLRHVAQLLERGPPALRHEVDAAIGELRELADGMLPAELAGGLGSALAALAERSPLDVSVRVTVDRLPHAVEAAAYFVCSEALANAAKHAGTARVTVNAAADARGLRLTIVDDGRGGADPHGAGLRGLADRVEALGGSLVVTSRPDVGTRLVGEIPCA
jgi:signal transduction histidine kinase